MKKIFTYITIIILFQNCSLTFKNLPKPKSLYLVGTNTFTFEDHSRKEWFTEEEEDNRKIVAQVWYPAESKSDSLSPYMDNFDIKQEYIVQQLNIPKHLIKGLKNIKTNSFYDAKIINQEFPVVIFSHGLGGTKIQNSINIEALASSGYIVIAIDHSYDAFLTIFNNGESAEFKSGLPLHELKNQTVTEEIFWETRLPQINTRANDVSFIIDKFTELKIQGLDIAKSCNLNKIGIFGHSFGGGTGIVVSYFDNRISACLSLDGWLEPVPQEIINSGLNIPYCFIGQIQKNWDGVKYNDKKLKEFHNNNNDDSFIFEINNSTHMDYADIPYFNPLIRVLKISGKAGKTLTIDLNKSIVNFFNQYLKNNSTDWYNNILNNYDTQFLIK